MASGSPVAWFQSASLQKEAWGALLAALSPPAASQWLLCGIPVGMESPWHPLLSRILYITRGKHRRTHTHMHTVPGKSRKGLMKWIGDSESDFIIIILFYWTHFDVASLRLVSIKFCTSS